MTAKAALHPALSGSLRQDAQRLDDDMRRPSPRGRLRAFRQHAALKATTSDRVIEMPVYAGPFVSALDPAISAMFMRAAKAISPLAADFGTAA